MVMKIIGVENISLEITKEEYERLKHTLYINSLAAKGFRKTLDPEKKEKIIMKLKQGWGYTNIRRELKCSTKSIKKIESELENDYRRRQSNF